MATYEVELDAIHIEMVEEITEGDMSVQDFLNGNVPNYVYNLYQRKKALQREEEQSGE